MDVVEIRAQGHITEEKMEQILDEVEPYLGPGEQGLLFTTEDLTGYDMGVRPIFIQWLLKRNDRVKKVALVSSQQLWQILVSTMASVIGVQIVMFEDEDRAVKWLHKR